MIDDVWHSEVRLNRAGRGIPFDSALVHRILTSSTGDPCALWCSPRPDVLLIQTSRPLAASTFDGEAVSIRQARTSLCFGQGARVELSGVVNATVCKRGHRREPLEADEVPGWLGSHLRGCAAAIDSVQSLSPAKGNHGAEKLTIGRTAFHGFATVADTAVFARMLACGVGRGKRFGAGLVLARRVA